MKWVIINENYLLYLRENFDKRIPYINYGPDKFKPFFGELFRIGEYSYITQVSSYKPRLEHIKEEKDFYKIYKNKKLIACVNLNYMFPILTKDLIYLTNYTDIKKYRNFKSFKEESNYISLLKYEIKEINKKPITISAKFLYKNKYEKHNNKLSKRCLDYKRLEEGCKKFYENYLKQRYSNYIKCNNIYNNYDNEIIQILLDEKKLNIKKGLYGLTQTSLGYNSNSFEGNTLTEENTITLFNDGKLYSKDTIYIAKHIEEMIGHFDMFNYMLNNIKKELSHELITDFYRLLKHKIIKDDNDSFAISPYKKFQNMDNANNIQTTKSDDVYNKMEKLLNWYADLKNINILVLSNLYEQFERIQPFPDGNEIICRIILFKECLKYNIIPFILQNKNKLEHYEAIKEAHNGNLLLLNKYLVKEQENYKILLKKYHIDTSLMEEKQKNLLELTSRCDKGFNMEEVKKNTDKPLLP